MPKRYSLPQAVIDHIFRGDNNNGSLAGFHSEARVKDAELVFQGDNQARKMGGLTYVAMATTILNGVRLGPKKSSFFPPGWTEEQTILWLEQGMTSMTPAHAKMSVNTLHYQRPLRQPHSEGVGAHFIKFKANKVTCYILYQGGQIASVFPYSPGFGED
jgi:hypothetical protein